MATINSLPAPPPAPGAEFQMIPSQDLELVAPLEAEASLAQQQSQSSMFATRVPNDLSWGSISLATNNRKILRNVWGNVGHGETLAVMGPSGAGKTSLLNVLAGRVAPNRNVTLSGNISINNELTHPKAYKDRVAYVTQTDALLSTFTPRESFRFSATLRLRNKTKAEIEEIVDQTLQALGLTLCADTLIGDELIRGISGLFILPARLMIDLQVESESEPVLESRSSQTPPSFFLTSPSQDWIPTADTLSSSS